MNKAKKLLALLLCAIICTFLCPSAFAAETTPTITLSNKSAMSGDTVTITIDISNNPGIMAMAFCVTYNNNSFEFTNYTSGIISGPTYKNHEDRGHIAFVYVGNNNISTNGTMMSVTFKVKDTAKAGKHIITLANSNRDKYGYKLHNSFSNSNQKFIVPTVKSGSITVGETCENSGHKYGEWTVTKEADCTKTGLKNHTCSRCNHFEEVEIPITHDFEAEWTVDKAATPNEDGVMSRHCKKCDEVTDKITFTYKEVEDSQNPDNNTSSDHDTSTDDISSDSNQPEEERTSSDTTTSNNNSSSSSSQNKTPINNTIGSKNPQSAVENIKDYQDNIKPNLENNNASSDTKNEDLSSENDTVSDNESIITDTDISDKKTDNSKPTLTTGDIVMLIIGGTISIVVIAIAIILIIKRKKAE